MITRILKKEKCLISERTYECSIESEKLYSTKREKAFYFMEDT